MAQNITWRGTIACLREKHNELERGEGSKWFEKKWHEKGPRGGWVVVGTTPQPPRPAVHPPPDQSPSQTPPPHHYSLGESLGLLEGPGEHNGTKRRNKFIFELKSPRKDPKISRTRGISPETVGAGTLGRRRKVNPTAGLGETSPKISFGRGGKMGWEAEGEQKDVPKKRQRPGVVFRLNLEGKENKCG